MKRFSGKVVRAKTEKTAHVSVIMEWMHPKYLKKKRFSRIFACHDETGVHEGDEVEIVECKSMSATKHFRIESVVKAATAHLVTKKVAVSKVKSAKKKKK